ncbi:GNAT family N-acetyltransferase [Ornithinimicrobium sp. INDO-MA30-4]|uniref:GNAT family N-acetyltransferase n=1 Tax=Ornithinimicrobium sp. INDO-MA30-4 TaxID=2908651 RepID=UPI001F1D634F|nr:hypothetical protein [Ornithinimicrobium sp. INDO-MA30-4]UJH69854.1 hypothetical protein L0A91_11440 [Ornithinimicrobium sp. INDO-MA30-4]
MTDKPAAKLTIRDATSDDAQACAQIYRPYVLDTTITFELVPPSPPEFAERIANAQVKHLWLVAEANEGPQAGRSLAMPTPAPIDPVRRTASPVRPASI